ncbi:MAG TPA: PD-(D/E)XK nuclease family protein [Steroidobacteraceae bacterium]|nr:PD-(D/E)XK nuclease family protein [Steroidobacteraceae bacterium]
MIAHLRRGGTIIVPSRQRAAALRLAHSAAMLASGQRVWESPDILPWSAWIERGLAEARAAAQPLPRRLSSLDDWLLCRAAVCEAAAGREILAPERLTDAVRHAVALLDDYGVALSSGDSAEAALLLSAREHYRRRCRELGVLASQSWADCRAFLRPSAAVLLAGFEAMGPARRRWLEQHGATLFEAAADAPEGETHIAGYADAAREAEAAADWCAAMLARDPAARVLLVVPRLAEQRHLWQRALSQRLDYGAILGTAPTGGAPDTTANTDVDANANAAESGTSAYAIEGGLPLGGYPLVAAALNLVAFAAEQTQFDQLSALLRTPYLAAFDRAACLQLDVWLREQNIDAATPTALGALREPITALAGARAGAMAGSLLEAVASVPAAAAPHAAWARGFAALLARCGWPGREALDSEQQQVRMRFDELLGELGAMEPDAGALSLTQASTLLQELAGRIAFEPATDDVAVTVTGRLDDPIVRYDGVWVAGLSADTWPPAARPDPLIPPPLQWGAGMPGVSAAGQLQRARLLQRQWLRAGAHCVLSWCASEQDLPADASPLLLAAGAAAPMVSAVPAALAIPAAQAAPAQVFSLEGWLAQAAPPLLPWTDVTGPAWPDERVLRGGTRLLELQSLCPFRSFAELRLSARALSSPQPGIDPRRRGRLLHRALELLWQQLGDLDTLKGLSDEAALALARRCVSSAIEETASGSHDGFEAWLLARERERTHELMVQLIGWERARGEHFVTHALEWPCSQPIAGTTLSLRVDRIDRLDDGRLIVIDYKSGSPEPFDADAPRPPQPQLPAYALAAGEQVAAVLAVYLGREGVRVRGIADRRDRIRRIAELPAGEADWPRLLQRWRERLQRLVEEFLRGHAAVEPQPRACDRCHLHGLCRIEPARLAAADPDGPEDPLSGDERLFSAEVP